MTTKQHTMDVLVKALKTFVELYVSVFAITPLSGWKTAAAGGLGSLLSIVWNTAVKLEANNPTVVTQAENMVIPDPQVSSPAQPPAVPINPQTPFPPQV